VSSVHELKHLGKLRKDCLALRKRFFQLLKIDPFVELNLISICGLLLGTRIHSSCSTCGSDLLEAYQESALPKGKLSVSTLD
jgi:hypothetical protein